MAQAKNGDKVKIHYTGKLNDGTVFDTSEDRDPLEFTLGSGQVISGFDKGVLGMEINEKKTINIPAAEEITPTWIYAIIGIGAALAVVVIVLIVRTRRP